MNLWQIIFSSIKIFLIAFGSIFILSYLFHKLKEKKNYEKNESNRKMNFSEPVVALNNIIYEQKGRKLKNDFSSRYKVLNKNLKEKILYRRIRKNIENKGVKL